MNASQLPTKLEKEPLIDVICEVRFDTDVPASSLLPGMLMSMAPSGASFEALPAAQLPSAIRDQDPNLRHAALMKMTWGDQFIIIFGDRSLGVGCKMPYAGWPKFKPVIESVFAVLGNAHFVKKIERHSLKYVDFFPGNEFERAGVSAFKVLIEVAGLRISRQATQLRVEIADGPFLHAVTLVSPAQIHQTQVPGNAGVEGSVLDVDTHRIQEFASVKDFSAGLSQLLEEIHDANKSFFFNLMDSETLKTLGPKYE